ncbi:Ribosomal protein S7 domain protein [Kalmanozyma brasiliensis GHG001]|uniref:Small ribosomal subunit protein uS7 domain-containing protein n=1 Tax=Kalmanozyma brasiliensis (strain GHG001) TaxID=1365824 RepID=V5F281_KALBG|nr:Ribosomal protein S7 domain protein [Kalmanozyma brasiliensis GHG001]EST09489.1 Ribosomal protein S7 domain protein [Kalmanozyma brasiliensis GHG001]
MASLLRAVTRTAVSAQPSIAGPSKLAAFCTTPLRRIADNKNDAAPARAHRAGSSAGPSSVASPIDSDSVGVTTGPGKTQRDAIDSAMGVLDNLARDVAGSPTSTSNTFELPDTPERPISTPSQGLTPVHVASGPLYSPTTLPPKADPTLEFLTNLLMKDGKKAQAQRFTTRTLALISTLTNSNPLPLIHDAITRTAPLVKLQSRKQGGKSLQVPVALTKRQSERKALTWIIEASKKRSDRELERRLASEFLAVVEGTSSAIQKKEEQHRIATVNRANASVRI